MASYFFLFLQNSFNLYPEHAEAELRLLSGRFDSAGITSLGAHWGLAPDGANPQWAQYFLTKLPKEIVLLNQMLKSTSDF